MRRHHPLATFIGNVVLLTLSALAWPVAPNTTITNTASATFVVGGLPYVVSDSETLVTDPTPTITTPSTLELFALGPGNPDALARNVQASACWDGNSFAPSGDATDPSAGSVALPQNLPLVAADRFSSGDAVYVLLTDPDQDVDLFARDRVTVDVTVPGQSDVERIRLTETGNATGVFAGHLQTGANAVQVNDCQLQADPGSAVEFAYVDVGDANDTALATAVLDPGFTIFSSLSGAPVDGVSVTLVDVATDAPAEGAVYAADGRTAFPATVVSGASAVDALGARVDFEPGTLRFPVIAPGMYRLELTPPPGINFPSSVSNADLNGLTSEPYLLVPGSRGGDFTVLPGVAPGFDVPVDPTLTDVLLSKQASKEAAAVGDFVQYQVQVQSAEGAGAIAALAVTDTLPKGFRYVPGSARLDGAVLADPQISGDGRGLVFADLPLASGGLFSLSYVTEITVGAELGRARNSATASGMGVADVNVAYADVVVREDLLTDKAIVVGRVVDGGCNALHDASGLDGVRVFLEDGRYVVTDAEGKFHFEGVDPGTHVVQLDASSLPGSHELVRCDAGTRFAGSGYSQFVDVQGGSLWRADFYVRPKPDKVTEFSARLTATADAERAIYRYELGGGDLPVTDVKAVVMLPPQLDYVPGSAQLNGAAIADPMGAAERALQFALPDSAGPMQVRIEFAAVASASGEFETKAITMFRSEAGAHRTPVAATALAVELPQRSMTLGDARVHFAEARSGLTAVEREKLSALGRKVKDQAVADLFVHVIGHADSKPLSRESQKVYPDNDTLSLRRAQGVANMLAAELGLPAERIRVASHGAAEPIADNTTDVGRALNRRVEVAVVGTVEAPREDTAAADSGTEVLAVRTSRAIADPAPYTIPPVDDGKPPQFDRAWLANAPVAQAIAWPLDDFNPSIPSTWVAVTHEPHLQAQLMVNGSLANPITFFGTVADRRRGIAVSIWENVGIREGDSELRVHLLDDTGASVSVLKRNVHFGGRPIRAELVPERSHLVADGITPPVLAVRFFDREGYPGRPGLTGEFSLGGSFQAYNLTRDLDLLDNSSTQGFQRYQVREDGIAFIRLEPTTQTGEVQLRFEFDEHRVAEVRARLRPGARDWILVGLAEGTVGYNSVSGNLQSLEEAGLADEVLADGRLAFYAKGQIKGEWLLTAAFDTDKEVQDRLHQQIDPNQFYTLYGDGTEQRFDAESRRKLYLKVEGAQFAALFGDFDTGWDRSEFTRYSRRMNGLQSNYYGTKWEVSAFASETELGFYRDELRGDGTSGTYRLSQRNLVANSERVRIVTRDRFRTEQVVEEVLLVRYVDYSIDYDAGSLIFKQPIFGQDQNFNPVFVEVEYEVGNEGGSEELVAGTRIAYQLDDQDSEVALTYIDDNTAGQAGALLGVDVRWDVTPSTRVNAEVAQTDSKARGAGDAYLLEVEHQSAQLAGRAYYREQDDNFGIGQQVGLEQGSRKVGAEGEYQLSDQLRLRADVFQQTETSTGNQRLVVSSLGEYRLGNTRLAGGARSIREEVADGERRDAEQVTVGVARNFLNNRLALRGDAELDVTGGGTNADYPSRAVVGAEYRLSHRLSLIGEQEFGFGARDTQDTRVGVKARPWQGADINTTLQRERGENAERVFATTGLLQQLQLNERWSVDFGVDRVKTLKQDGERPAAEEFLFNPGLPPALGSFDDDFTAFYTGFGYRREQWDVSSRIELHQGDRADKWNYLLGASHQLADGKVMSGSLAVLTEETIEGNVRDQGEARWGVAWRPAGESLLFLNRLDLVFAKNKGDGFDTRTHKLINNFNANFRPDLNNQVSLQLGVKYVVEDIDGEQYDGLTGLLGLEYRRSMGARWDLGLRAASLHSFASKVSRLSAGVSVGRNLFKNAWASLGYNFVGFSDRDFMAADYTAQGPYLKLRLKLDQDLMKRFLSFAGWRNQPASTEKLGAR